MHRHQLQPELCELVLAFTMAPRGPVFQPVVRVESTIVDEFIRMVTQQLGIGESESRAATGGILKVLKEQLGESSFSTLLDQLPGADTLVSEAESGVQPQDGGGLMGSLTSMAGNLLGGGEGGVADIAKAVGDAGIGLDKAGGFVSTFVTFLKEKLGDDVFNTIASKLPGLLK